MPSLMAGTDAVICRAMGIRQRSQLGKPGRPIEHLSLAEAKTLVRGLYQCIAGNYPGQVCSRTGMLWKCRRASSLADRNCSAETLLEKAVANLAQAGHMPDWFNQCPVATGVVDPSADRRRCIDLVCLDGEKARFVELKWGSDAAASALFQVVEYGLAWLFAWLRKEELGLANRPLMSVFEVSLEVLAPHTFYLDRPHRDLFAVMHEALGAFVACETKGTVSMSLRTLAFPETFTEVPFANGREVKALCGPGSLTPTGQAVRDAFSGAAPPPHYRSAVAGVEASRQRRFLPGVPAAQVEEILAGAAGNEIARGKFDHPESSAALAANALGFFLNRAAYLPPIPEIEDGGWPARSVTIEANVRFPWSGGRHPWLDALVATRSALIGIESKRYEPFRKEHTPKARFSDAYWRPVWGDKMAGYEGIRDALRVNPSLYSHLDAAQLVKHALALRTEAHREGPHRGLKPVLLYLYAQPEVWAASRDRVEEEAKARHRHEIAEFSSRAHGDEVVFVACSYRRLLEAWSNTDHKDVRDHAVRVAERFGP